MKQQATAFAPACVGNLAVGFDCLGHAISGIGNRVTARRQQQPEVVIESISGNTSPLPMEAALNCAGRAAQSLLEASDWPFGVRLALDKSIPLSSGMGGSAADAVAAVVAVNALLEQPLKQHALLPFALEGEKVAAGAGHYDNIAPSLLGGLVLVVQAQTLHLPVPAGLRAVVVHPALEITTRDARQRLLPLFELERVTAQGAALAGFITACHNGDLDLLSHCMQDHLVEPRRRDLVPGFDRVKRAALVNGALGCSLSGSGPSLFAWCRGEADAERCARAMVDAFRQQGLPSDYWVSEIDAPGARLENENAP